MGLFLYSRRDTGSDQTTAGDSAPTHTLTEPHLADPPTHRPVTPPTPPPLTDQPSHSSPTGPPTDSAPNPPAPSPMHDSSSVATDRRAAIQAFKKHRGELLDAIQDPIHLSNHLYAAGVIPNSVLDEVSTLGVPRNAKNNAILNAVEARLRIKSSDFWVVAATLEAIVPLKILATRLRDSYGTLICL